LRQSLEERGRKLVACQYDWRVIGDRLYSIYENAAGRAASQDPNT
jgi:hypothetical protein